MVRLNNITKAYDGNVLLNKVNIVFNRGDVIGVVGSNGSGKSTLFKIIGGEVAPDEGKVEITNESIGYLPQYPVFDYQTVEGFFKSVNPKAPEYQYDICLNNVGIENIDLTQTCESLSGGQKTKIYLASILLRDPEVSILLLDEPTNNLDLEGLEWLESFINNYQGIVLLTSHDRFFLDRVSQRIIEIQDGKIKSYGGNYTFYKQQKLIENEALERKYVVQQKRINKIEKDILDYKQRALAGERKFTSRNPYEKKKAAKTARVAIVREKKLEKELASEEHIEKPKVRRNYGINLKGETNSGKLIVEVKEISKKFNGKLVVSDVSFSIRGSEHCWIVGKNGSGKTTLLKSILGEITPDSGEIKLGTGIKIGYFAQETQLNPENIAIDELRSTGADPTSCFITAAHMHLIEEDLRKKIGQLSRGQIAKLEFTKILLSDNNLIILDEPTNHLEIETREDIEKALEGYKGAIIVASHDRYFVDRIGVDKIVEV